MNEYSLKLNGRMTVDDIVRKKVTYALKAVSGSGSVSVNNNKNNSNGVRAVVALDEKDKAGWIEAYVDCIKRKLRSEQCLEFRIGFEDELWSLVEDVYSFGYEPQASYCFIVTRPKLREVFAASFRDRIVQHWIILRLEPLFEERFIGQGDVSFNCRKGYGSLNAVKTLQRHIDKVSEGYKRQTWIGKFDLRSFFMSIDKRLLLDKLIKFIDERYKGEDKEVLKYLTEKTVLHKPERLCVRRSKEELWAELPKDKSLFGTDGSKGLAIGNITSQLFANFYMTYFNDYVVGECRKTGSEYMIFADDFFIVSRDKGFILHMRKEMNDWLEMNLRLTLHKDKFYLQEVKKGVKAVGYVIKPHRIYVGNRTVGNMYKEILRTDNLCKKIIEEGITLQRASELRKHINSLNSYNGFLVHAKSFNIKMRMFGGKRYFWQICYMSGRNLKIKVRNKYNYKYIILAEDEKDYGRAAPAGGGRKGRVRTKNIRNKRVDRRGVGRV